MTIESATSEPIDWKRLNDMRDMDTDGIPGLADKMVRSYVENSRRRLLELQSAMTAADTETVRRLAHSIKSTSANVGASALSELGRLLEQATLLPQWRAAQQDVDGIATEFRRVETALRQHFALPD